MLVTTREKLNATGMKDFEGYERDSVQDVTYAGYGEPVNIMPPEQLLSIKDAMNAIFSTMTFSKK